MVFLNKVFVYLRNFVFLKHSDVFLISYPKSGNTWVRFYVCNLINELPEFHFTNSEITFSVLDSMMPEMGFSNLKEDWKFNSFPRIVKSHRKYSFLFSGNKSVLLIRDPKDVMISYYEFDKKRTKPKFNGSFSEFIRDKKFGLPAWCKHYLSWINNVGYVLRYEDLKIDDHKVFKSFNEFLDINVSESAFHNAVMKSRFENVSKMELKSGQSDKNKHNKDFKFTRSGKSGQWIDYFSKDDLSYCSAVLRKFSINEYN